MRTGRPSQKDGRNAPDVAALVGIVSSPASETKPHRFGVSNHADERECRRGFLDTAGNSNTVVSRRLGSVSRPVG